MKTTFKIIAISLFSASTAVGADGLRPSYEVYDANSRPVGVTKDGVNVTAKFKGHEVIFVIRAGGSADPDYANALGIIYESLDCQGDPYVASITPQGMDPDYPIMDGVLPTVSVIGRLPEAPAGKYVYGDPYAQAKTFSGTYSFFPILYGVEGQECVNFESAPFPISAVPAIKFKINWVAPLTVSPPP